MISVALCTYNGEKYIKQQLESILNQTTAVTEIVILDDCSSDMTVQVIHEVAKLHPGVIKLNRNEHNIGFRKNFEKALIKCEGDFIFFSDQDDVWREDKVERVVSFLKDSEMWGAFTNGDLIDEKGNKLGTTLFECLNVDKYLACPQAYPDLYTMLCLNPTNFVTGATIAISKRAKKLLLPFYTSKRICHDHFIALKLSSRGKFACINECLISYRIHTGQQIGLGNLMEKPDCLYNQFKETDSYNKEGIKRFCFFLMKRRIMSASIIHVCRLSHFEQRLLKNKYIELLYSKLSCMGFLMRTTLYLHYLYSEYMVQIRRLRLFVKALVSTKNGQVY